jgi:hypothetical protein
MTIAHLETLSDVIDYALELFRGTKGNREIADWIMENYPHVLTENAGMLSAEGLTSMIRRARKNRPPCGQDRDRSIRQMCIDFGVKPFDLDTEISIPMDRAQPLGCAADWKEFDDATLEEIEAHINLLKTQARKNDAMAEAWERIVDAARDYQRPGEQVCLRELQQRARANRQAGTHD